MPRFSRTVGHRESGFPEAGLRAGVLPSQSRLMPCQRLGCRLGRPLGNVPPGRSGPRRGSRVSSPPEACKRPSLASPFGGRWCPVGTVQRLVSAAASVGDGRSPLGCITRAGRRECPRRGRRGRGASGPSPKQSLFALTYRPAVPYNQTTSWGSSLLGLPSGNVNTLANAWYCLKKRDSWKTSI